MCLTRWRNEREQHFPEDGEEVHDVVTATGRRFVVIVVRIAAFLASATVVACNMFVCCKFEIRNLCCMLISTTAIAITYPH